MTPFDLRPVVGHKGTRLLQILQNKMLNKIKQIAKTTHVNNTKKVAL